MANCSMHWAQGEHNEALANELIAQSPIRYPDWAAIGAFYAALHFFESFLASTEGKHADDEAEREDIPAHTWRRNYVRKAFPGEIARAYVRLFDASMMLRYLQPPRGAAQFGPGGSWMTEEAAREYVKSHLRTVKEGIVRKFEERQAASSPTTPAS